MTINPLQLHKELLAAGIQTCGCNSKGVVWDMQNNEIQNRKDVAVIVAAHKPVIVVEKSTIEVIEELKARLEVVETKVTKTEIAK